MCEGLEESVSSSSLTHIMSPIILYVHQTEGYCDTRVGHHRERVKGMKQMKRKILKQVEVTNSMEQF